MLLVAYGAPKQEAWLDRNLAVAGRVIEAGGLEQLWVAPCEAASPAKGWHGVASLLSDAGTGASLVNNDNVVSPRCTKP